MPSQKLSIQVREATVKDLNRIADISSLAFLNNALFDNLNPRRHEYFESFRYTRLRYARNAMLKPSMRLLVAETDSGDVVGYAIWERLGDDPIAQRVKAERDGIRLRTSSYYSSSSPTPPLTIVGNEWMNERMNESNCLIRTRKISRQYHRPNKRIYRPRSLCRPSCRHTITDS